MTEARAAAAYRALAPGVLAYLRASGAADPDDLLGEVFLQVARDLRRFRGDDDELRRWVFAIARHRLIDASRRRARRPEQLVAGVPERTASVDPVELAPDPALAAALRALTVEQREVVLLRFVADLSLEQVAALTGRTVGAVKAMQHRALSALARALAVSPGGPPAL